MEREQLSELEELAESARRALRAADRLHRIARQSLAQLSEQLEAHRPCSAQGGTAHDSTDREPVHAR